MARCRTRHRSAFGGDGRALLLLRQRESQGRAGIRPTRSARHFAGHGQVSPGPPARGARSRVNIFGMAQRDKLGHRPFEGLKLSAPAPKPARAPSKIEPKPAPTDDDRMLFVQAMQGVRPLPRGPERVLVSPPPRLPDPDAEHDEVRAELTGLVRGEVSFRLSDTDEYLEGAAPDLDRRTRLRLRRGEFAIQGHLDLHGR